MKFSWANITFIRQQVATRNGQVKSPNTVTKDYFVQHIFKLFAFLQQEKFSSLIIIISNSTVNKS